MQKEKNRKGRRLYLQISLIIIPLFLLTALIIAFVVYNSTLNGFLEAQNSLTRSQRKELTGILTR